MNLPLPRPTSLAAWHALLDSDKLNKLYREVIRALYHNGPSTATEIGFYAKKSGLWKRTSELRDAGFIEEVRKRPCSITKEEAVEWGLPAVPPEDFDSLVLFYKVEGVYGYTNRTWAKQTRFLSLRRKRTVEDRLETAFKKADSHVEFVRILSYVEIDEEEYEAALARESLSDEAEMSANLIVQGAKEVCDQFVRIPTALKSSIDRRAVGDFDEFMKMIDGQCTDLKFVVSQAAHVVIEANKSKGP